LKFWLLAATARQQASKPAVAKRRRVLGRCAWPSLRFMNSPSS